MEAGERQKKHQNTTENEISPIVKALRFASIKCGIEIRVHLSQRRAGNHALAHARAIALRHGLAKNPQGLLIYFNLHTHTFAFVYGVALDDPSLQPLWRDLAQSYRDDLHATHYENATSLLIRTVALLLAKPFPPIETPFRKSAP